MQFEVRVFRDGQIASIVINALNSDDACRQAEAQALRPISAQPLRSQVAAARAPRARRFDLLLFCQELLALLEAGLVIIEAIDTLSERERSGDTRSVLGQLARRLREGQSFSGALDGIPEAFPALFIGIVRSSERTGDLQPALERYIDYRTRLDALRSKLVSAAIYPSLLLIVGIIVTLFLGGYVVPRFASVYQGTGRPLPWASALLLEWGKFANAHLTELLVGASVTAVGVTFAIRTLLRRGGWSVIVPHLPIISGHLRIYELSRLYLTLGMLLDSGLPIMTSLTLAQSSLPAHHRAPIDRACQLIRQGERFSQVFDRQQLTTPVGLRMMQVGEESGRLGDMLTRAARFHDGEIARWLDRFTRTAEPVLMIAIGLVVGTIVILLYMPIFDLAGSLQ